MADELDLENPPDDESPTSRRRRERRASRTTQTDSKPKSDAKTEGALSGRLNEAFAKLANQLHAKGDEELATAIEEERRGMTAGLMSLTSSITPLRGPLVAIVELSLVFLAFWRVGRILLLRMVAYRERIAVQRAEYQYPEEPPSPAPFPEGAVVQ